MIKMKKITKRIAAIIASAAMISSFGITVSAKTFPDVPTTHWAYATINSVTDEGIFKGMTDGTFHPDDIITHEEFTTAIINYVCAKLGQGTMPVSQDYEQYITDDKTDNRYWNNRWVSWAQPSLNKAVELGIIGTSGTYTDELKEYYEEAVPKRKTTYSSGETEMVYNDEEGEFWHMVTRCRIWQEI